LNFRKTLSFPVPTPFKVLSIYFIGLLLLMGFWRVIFLFSNLPQLQFNHIQIYIKSFYVALRLDAVVASYLCLPVFLTIFLPYIGWISKIYRNLFFLFIGIIATLYSFLSIADIEFYKELGTHLNILCWQPNVLSRKFGQFVWVEYPIIYYLFSIATISYLWNKLLNKIIRKQKKQFSSIFSSISFFIIGFLLIGTFIRGGWQQRPIDWGHAMFSDNPFANQTALNPLFNLGRSLIQLNSEKNIAKLVKYMDYSSALIMTRKTIKSQREIFTDSLSFKREIINPHVIKPNIVLVVLESFLGKYCGSGNANKIDVTPNLNRMADNGINCTRTIASGKRSAYGLSTILCSWPPLPGFPLISQVESQQDVENIASLLKDIGYSTWFMYGGDADFDNMKGFALANGFDHLIEQNDFPKNTPGTMWGVFDEYLFDYAESILDASQVPVLLTMFTTTNHQPWDIPGQMENIIPHFLNDNKRIKKVMRTMAYTDYIIGEFIEDNQSKAWFQNTIFVFISDHGINEYSDMYEDPRNAHIPFIIYSPAIITKPKRINAVTSQIDVLPTLLHLIGYPKPFELMGTNILSDNYSGVACRIVNDHCMWFEGDYLYIETFNQNTELFQYSGLYDYPYLPVPENSEFFKSIQANFHAYLQSAYFQFKK
jgi:phosphoglycerol transferase MdoB-like AlkP superfamily enzyme